jgi:thymidylate synthase
MDRCINGHLGIEDNETWSKIATDEGIVNSNYGWMVYDPENGDKSKSQFDYAIAQLRDHPDGRQSVIYYSRPSMQWEWNDGKNAKHDFTCTFATQHFIRDNKLEYIVYMRSNDSIFGLINDFAHHVDVYEQMRSLLKVNTGTIHWNAGSLHVYERHWELMTNIVKEYKEWACKEFIKDAEAKGFAPPY